MSAKKKKKSEIKTAWQGHGTKIEIHPDGKVVVYAKGDVEVKPARANDTAVAAAKAALEVGAKMADGSVFAGLTIDGSKQIFAMPADMDVTLTFNDAAKRVKNMNNNKFLGHDDWQIPTHDQLNVLYQNQDKGALKGTFNTTNKISGSGFPYWYWSSTENRTNPSCVWFVRLSSGNGGWNLKDYDRLSCRPVRLVEASAPRLGAG